MRITELSFAGILSRRRSTISLFERAAEVQILAMSTGKELKIAPEAVANQFLVDMKKDGGKANWVSYTSTR